MDEERGSGDRDQGLVSDDKMWERFETENTLRAENARLRRYIEAVLSFCEFEEDRVELSLAHRTYIAEPSRDGQFEFLIALWNLREALKGQGE